MIKFGEYNTLEVSRVLDFGYYLDVGEDHDEILLPKKLAKQKLNVGDSIEVFVYFDSEDRPIATTQIPILTVGQFAYLEVVDSTPVGAFLNWGLDKDLLVPFGEQHRPLEVGQSYLVFAYLDDVDGRITASSKVDKILDDERPHTFNSGDAVDMIIANSTDLGFKVIINHNYWGVLHSSEVSERLSFGQSVKGYIKHIRPDKKMNVSLQTIKAQLDKNAQILVDYLELHEGVSRVHDKSSPEDIKRHFGLSKGAFKKAVGNLLREQRIRIDSEGIYLL
jgi:predicted RNA-binding protein (virulence factor B family)